MTLKAEGKAPTTKVARTYRGLCAICYQPIVAGEAYEEGALASNVRAGSTVHYNCYQPLGAPTYEELKARVRGQEGPGKGEENDNYRPLEECR